MRRDEKIILMITGGSHLSVHSLMLVFPNILLVLQKEYQAGLDTLGFVAMASAFMFGLGAIPTGYLESRIGGRNQLLAYQFGTSFSAVLVMLSQSLFTMTIGLMLLGLFSSIYHPAGLTLISRRVTNISKGMAIHGIAGSIGLAIGPIMASVFTEFFSWRVAYGTLAGFNLLLALGTLSFIGLRKGKVQEVDEAQTESTDRSALALYYGIMVLMGMAFTGFTTFMPAHFAVETRNVLGSLSDTLRGGVFTTTVLIFGIIGQMIGGYLGSRYNRVKLLFLIVLINVPFMFLFGILSGIPVIIFGIILGIVHFSVQPVGNSIIAQYTHSQHRGLGYGISFFFSFGVGSVAAGLSGLIAENIGISYVFPAMALILLPGVWLAYLFTKKR
ncbi:MAG: MFS transporter [FCB group bacterium]|nr:MFS transporter [FCB group bacterium]